ncbi:hypothetical protein ACQPW1_09045 [Nocardia sp. CA-128927]|uniref:hypothetical protein n=1 Tax=Nocardia sp. CA-128927 TaxID=3239975 RepID=UPI003D98BBF0
MTDATDLMRMYLVDPDQPFPPVELADPSGLVALGGDLSPERLLAAYSAGIFPWYNPGETIHWYCPDPRSILVPTDLHTRAAARPARSGPWQFEIPVPNSPDHLPV